jgi:curved DNA-binding protein CbpA
MGRLVAHGSLGMMSGSTFRGDPYRVLDLAHESSGEEIKRRWRDLAREHHPDLANGDPVKHEQLTTRMARINAAYDLLRDPVRRARYDASPEARRARGADAMAGRGAGGNGRRRGPFGADRPAGPPPPPPSRPITGRFDMSATFLRRNTTLRDGPTSLRGHIPVDWRMRQAGRDLRASTPTGPVRRSPGQPPPTPTLSEANDTVLGFGRFHGLTLGEVARLEPTYIDWIASTVTRDRDLVVRARVVAADLDARGVARRPREERMAGAPEPAWTAERTAG